MRHIHQILLSLFVALLLQISTQVAALSQAPDKIVGSSDFIQYWSAFHLLNEGVNPYDGIEMHRKQVTVGQKAEATILMWNPPWTVLLLSPILILPFPVAVVGWFIVNIFILSALVILASRVTGCRKIFFLASTALCFLPALETIQLGQISLFLALAMMLGGYLIKQSKDFLGGAALAVLTIKPHLFFLLFIPSLVWLMRTKRFFIIGGFAATTTALVLLSLCLWPQSLSWWVSAVNQQPVGAGAVAMINWRTATVVTQLRTILGAVSGDIPSWPIWVIPSLSLVIVSLYYMKRDSFDWLRDGVLLICLSLGLGSYGWFFDQAILLPFQLLLVGWSLEVNDSHALRRALFVSLVAIQLFALLLGLFKGVEQASYFWLPFAFLTVWQRYQKVFVPK